jgi:hypothetical protein
MKLPEELKESVTAEEFHEIMHAVIYAKLGLTDEDIIRAVAMYILHKDQLPNRNPYRAETRDE